MALKVYQHLTYLKPIVVSWIENNGSHIVGPCREIYLRYERDGDQKNYMTEGQFPVAKG